MGAAISALAANQQGKFWEYHSNLFENYNQLNEEKFDEIAQLVGLNMDQFEEDKKNPALAALVQRDLQDPILFSLLPAVFVVRREVSLHLLLGRG